MLETSTKPFSSAKEEKTLKRLIPISLCHSQDLSPQGAARGANTCAPLRAVLVRNICALLQPQSHPAGPGPPNPQLASGATVGTHT